MKKILITFLTILIFPLNMLAYSEYIIPGGENVGININTNGLIVIGFYKVNDEFIGKENIKIGDYITEINGNKINSIKEMTSIINKNIKDNKIDVTIIRNNKKINTYLNLIKENNVYKTGLYVKDNVIGIGTLTYIDPNSKILGSLGHQIELSNIKQSVNIKSGNVYDSFVESIDKSYIGKIGSKNAIINYDTKLGEVSKNSTVGLFGKYTAMIPDKKLVKVADFDDIKLGEAYIYTNIDGTNVKKYKIKINNLDKSKIKTSKSITFKIDDTNLTDITGGIIQGMSGSPIIQDDKIIGAVTHVIVSSPNEGYGVFIRTMLEEGER